MSEDKASILQTLNIISTVPSIIGSFVMIYLTSRVRNKTLIIQLIKALAISDLFYSFSNVMVLFSSEEGSFLCNTEGFFKDFFLKQSIFWTTSIAVLHYYLATKGEEFDKGRFLRITATIATSASLLSASSPFLFSNYLSFKKLNLMCLLQESKQESTNFEFKLMVFILYQVVPIFLAFLITLFCYILTIRKINAIPAEFREGKSQAYHLLWYPAVLFIAFLPIIIYEFMTLCLGITQYFILQAFMMVCTHAIGLLNLIIYGIQRGLYVKEINTKEDRLSVTMSFEVQEMNNSTRRQLDDSVM